MSEFKVFYSWQSDLPNSTNRGFIGDALEKACKQIASNPEIDESPRVDQDTKGVPGSPPIPATIMEKIKECQVFVADVSICFTGPNGKLAPNPNVLFELGYAVSRLGWDRIILVMNLEYGSIESLPFDLEKRRVTGIYFAKEGEANRSEQKTALADKLVAGIKAVASLPHVTPGNRPVDDAIMAVENILPSRKVQVRKFWTWALEQLTLMKPKIDDSAADNKTNRVQIALLKEALSKTELFVRDWSRACEAVALSGDAEVGRELISIFPKILPLYDRAEGEVSYSPYLEYDYWRFLGHELFTIWMSSLLKEESWGLIRESAEVLRVQMSKSVSYDNGRGGFRQLSSDVRLLQSDSVIQRLVSSHAELIRDRFSRTDAGIRVSHREFVDADVFLFFLAYFSEADDSGDLLQWFPWSALHLIWTPDFLVKAKHHVYAKHIKSLWGMDNSASVRDEMMKLSQELARLWGVRSLRFQIERRDLVAFDSIP